MNELKFDKTDFYKTIENLSKQYENPKYSYSIKKTSAGEKIRSLTAQPKGYFFIDWLINTKICKKITWLVFGFKITNNEEKVANKISQFLFEKKSEWAKLGKEKLVPFQDQMRKAFPLSKELMAIIDEMSKQPPELQKVIDEAQALCAALKPRSKESIDAKEKPEILNQINQIRSNLIKMKKTLIDKSPEMNACNSAIKELEEIAIKKRIVKLYTNEIIMAHMKAAKEAETGKGILSEFDGKIFKGDEGVETSITKEFDNIPAEYQKALGNKIVVEQLPGLHQYDGTTNLCPYYSLYFLLTAFESPGKPFNDRVEFNKWMKEWQNISFEKDARTYISTKQDPIPDRVPVVPFIQLEAIKHIIEQNEALKKLRDSSQILIFDLFELYPTGPEAALYDKDSDRVIRMTGAKRPTPSSPLFMIVQIDNHVHFFHAKREGEQTKITIVHSLGYEIFPKISPKNLGKLVKTIAKEWQDAS